MKHCITRRAMLFVLPASLPAGTVQSRKPKQLPRIGEFVRLLDPTTEGVIVRLTSLTSTSLLPAPTNRFVSARDRFLIFSSNRTGKLAPFQLSLRTGVLRQLAETSELDPRSLCLDESERFLQLIDKGALKQVALATKRVRTVAEGGISAFGAARSGSRLMIVRDRKLQSLDGDVIARNVTSECLVRPDGTGCFFARTMPGGGSEFWYAPFASNGGSEPRLLAEGRISFPFWSPDGQFLLFLRQMEKEKVTVSEIRQVHVESLVEQRLAPTSQFAAFSPNRDASVFVGASGSKAQPDVILLLRSPKREMTLCEHRARHAAAVSPVFSPDSSRVYFESDREGKSALYSVNVETFVERTGA